MRSRRSVCAGVLVISSLVNCSFAHAAVHTSVVNHVEKISADRRGIAIMQTKYAPLEEKNCQKILEDYLEKGRLSEGEAAFRRRLRAHPTDDSARFGLAVTQFTRAVERLAQDFYRYGLRDKYDQTAGIPFMRLPLPLNPNPEAASYQKFRTIVKTLAENLMQTEVTLAQIKDVDVKLPVRFGMIRMDLNGDGQAYEEETLWRLYASLNNSVTITQQEANNFSITFDRGDVHWLRGYCHLLTAMCEIYLAHDSRETFEDTAHLFFTKVESPCQFLTKDKNTRRLNGFSEIVDFVALLHLINWQVIEPERMRSALAHLEQMVAQSKEMWKYIMAETDDDHEWIPNPKQTGVIPGVRVTQEMVDSWTGLMGQIEQILAGKKLIAFWRGNDGRGVNLRRVFLEPRRLDLVLWVQGSAAAPYLERGGTTKIETWRSLQRAFGSQFPGFALWFN